MEASDAGLSGNGILVICGQFEPYAIVRLHATGDEGVLRAEGSPVVAERVVDQNAEVGFEGLTPGDRFIAAGYTRGRYEEVRCVAQDPSSEITLLQPPVQPSPQTLGMQGTSIANSPAAPSDAQADLGVGIPEGVESPLLLDSTPSAPSQPIGDVGGIAPVAEPNPPAPEAGTPDASDSGQANGGAVEEPAEVATPVPPVVEQAPEPVEAPSNVETPPAEPASEPAPEPSPEPPPAEPAPNVEGEAQGTPSATDPAPAPVEATPAPDAAVEPPAGPPADVEAANEATPGVASVEAQAQPSGEVDHSESPEQTSGGESPEDPATDSEKLVAQANELGIENAASLSDAELRQAITEKNVTPVI